MVTIEYMRRSLGGNTPLELSEAGEAWLLESGEVDLFVVPTDQAGQPGRRLHIGTATAGTLLVSAAEISQGGLTWRIVAVGVDAHITRVEDDWARRLTDNPATARGLHRWLKVLATLLAIGGAAVTPQDATPQDTNESRPADVPPGPVDVPQGAVVSSPRELTWWIPETSTMELAGQPVPAGAPLPVAGRSCLVATTTCRGSFHATSHLTVDEQISGLHWVTQTLITALAGRALERESQATAWIRRRQQHSDLALASAMSELATLDRPASLQPTNTEDPVLSACKLLGQDRGFTIRPPQEWARDQTTDPIRAIARASGIRTRAVTLTGQWWRHSIEPMIAFRDDLGAPVALLPRPSGGYELAEPPSGARVRIDQQEANRLRPTAYILYAPLPVKSMNIVALVRFGLAGCQNDLRRTIGFSLTVGLLALASPAANGFILGTLVPRGNTHVTLIAAVSLALITIAGTGFLLSRSAALLRVQGRMLSRVQTGLWDRLLALPTEFFHRYQVADLAQRLAGVESAQQIIAQVASQALLALVTVVFSMALLFAYHVTVATIVLVVTLIVVAAGLAITLTEVRRLHGMYDARGRAAGTLLHIVQGIDKVRAAAAENRALDQWARLFATQTRLSLAAQRLAAARFALYGALPVALTATVFAVVGYHPGIMSTGAFLAIVAALGQAAAATSQLDLTVGYLLNIVPLIDRVRPIIEETVEVTPSAITPGTLTGNVSLNNVSFRYQGMSSLVLHDIDLTVTSGEFLAIVGPSGCGKSTIVRLLLGFEHPETGTVTYDAKDLATLDVRAIRSQIGVVMQNAAVFGNDVLSVIRGDGSLTEQEAWHAAEHAGIADDIRRLPMGMQTMIGDNAGTFSGGQRQRLVLAAAVARKPRIVILDEATSALDSVTQAHVTDSFARLRATRIVIAHRLSTIRQADRIVVVEQGRIVQQGTYQELSQVDGLFQSMVHRQSL